jgi:hypothetical protein
LQQAPNVVGPHGHTGGVRNAEHSKSNIPRRSRPPLCSVLVNTNLDALLK